MKNSSNIEPPLILIQKMIWLTVGIILKDFLSLIYIFVQVIHYELPNDPETFVHRSGRTGRAGKEGNAILMFTSSQRRTVRSLERDVGCRFDFVSPPSVNEVLGSSAEQVVASLGGVHSESIEYFMPTAKKLMEEQGVNALAAALALLGGFAKPPSSRSLITHEQVNYRSLELCLP